MKLSPSTLHSTMRLLCLIILPLLIYCKQYSSFKKKNKKPTYFCIINVFCIHHRKSGKHGKEENKNHSSPITQSFFGHMQTLPLGGEKHPFTLLVVLASNTVSCTIRYSMNVYYFAKINVDKLLAYPSSTF